MLVLTRRSGESIVIDGGIKLTVVSIGPGRVKIGVEAPPSVRVDRSEIHERVQNEQASDVLAAVSQHARDESDDGTMVVAGPETGVLSSPPVPQPQTPTPSSTPTGSVSGQKLSKFRAPRKPR